MKKTTIIAAFLLVVSCTTALAAEDTHASQSQTLWVQKAEIQTLKFMPSDTSLNTRNILSTELPATLRKDLKKEYKDYWISELYEQGSNKHLEYFITIENADQVVKLNSSGSKNWNVDSTVLKPL